MESSAEAVDVLIIGAGLSGIGGACQLRSKCPDQSFIILEAREASGGTWDLFRYPGIRSDSDMYTMSYGFKPWRDSAAIADGDKILSYIREAAAEYDVERHIRYQHRAIAAQWSSSEKRWRVTAERGDTGEEVTISCRFIFSCSGYYDYESGYVPEFTGVEDFQGQVFHAQHWHEALDYTGKRVVVIGSGATAVTLVPTMSHQTSRLVMLQRSPTYIANVPQEDPTAQALRKFLPVSWAFRITRWKKVLFQIYLYRLSRRLCAVPNGDMFAAIREGRAEVVTDHIAHFTATGIQLQSGAHLEADIVIMATGLNLKFAGGVEYQIDGRPIDFTEHFIYRGMMFSDLPNMAFTVGYTNSSWTLKVDLTANYVCRLLNHMKKHGYARVMPRLKGTVEQEPFLDFDAGYVLRSRNQFPKQGNRLPWKNYQNYIRDFISLRLGKLRDEELEFQ
jgi:monooxygenase